MQIQIHYFFAMNKGKHKGGPSVSGRLVDIELPLEGTRTKLNINPTTTARYVLEIISKRPYYENTSYAFSLVPSNARKKVLPPSFQLATATTVSFLYLLIVW